MSWGLGQSLIGPALRFVALSSVERWLLLRAAVLVFTIPWILRIVPLRRLLSVAPAADEGRARAHSRDRIAWAVTAAGRYVPGGRHCLTQALAMRAMLGRSGVSAELRVGIARRVNGQLEGHAWLDQGGLVVIGGPEVERYTVLRGSFGQ